MKTITQSTVTSIQNINKKLREGSITLVSITPVLDRTYKTEDTYGEYQNYEYSYLLVYTKEVEA